jgi:taurine--2-oxoglutarate transaminase
MTTERAKGLESRQRRHVLFTWSAQNEANAMPIAKGDGAWFIDHDGQRWLDFESQVFNCNIGHGQTSVIDAMKAQLDDLACAHPAAVYEAKADLGEKLAEITPGDIDRFFICLSGSEANENALKIARMFTGRSKVIARRRSYHGASMGALSLTGDRRRLSVEPGLWGVERIDDPYCYRCPYGLEPGSCAMQCATQLENVILAEGADRIAAVFIEGVTGANGGYVPPDGYWPKIREICDRYGVLLVADEVFSGFGRTGKWFAVDHWGVVPDLITMAKGVSGGYAPLGVVGMRPHIADHFNDNTLWAGLTGYAHPVSVAAGSAAIDAYRDQGLIERSAALESTFRAGLDALAVKHRIIGDVRCIGLFGTLEFVRDRETREPWAPYQGSAPADSPVGKLGAALRARRVHAAVRENSLFITPPLVISEADLQHGLDLIDDALTEVTS